MLVGLMACTVQYRDAVDGKAVQQKIDETIAPLIKSHYPGLKVAPSQCEPIIEIVKGTMGHCTLPVNGVPLQVRVASAGPPGMFKVDFGGKFFFDMTAEEKIIENSLAHDYQVPVSGIAQCGTPRERLLLPGTYMTCRIGGTPLVRSVRLKVMQNGQMFLFNAPGLKVASGLPDSLLTLHGRGEAVIVAGAEVAAYIKKVWVEDAPSSAPNVTIECPARMNLTGTKRGVCTASIPGVKKAQRLGFWIDANESFHVRPIDAVVDRSKVQQMAQADLNRRLIDNGDAADAVVTCKKGLIVITPPATFDCQATAGGKRYRLVVNVQDWKGTVSWRGIPIH